MSAPTPTILTKTPIDTVFELADGNLLLNDYYGEAGIYPDYNIPLDGVAGIFKVTAPDGTVIYNNTNIASPDVSNPVWFKRIALPTNANGSFVTGIYTAVYTSQITDGVHAPYTLVNTATYNLAYTRPAVSITQVVDCISPNFTTVDTTNYLTVNGVSPNITRTLTLNFPVGSAGFDSPLTTSTDTISTGVFYQNTQTTEVSTSLLYTLPATGDYPTFAIADTVEGTKEILVDCTFICSIYCCIQALEQRMDNAEGVNQVLFEKYTADFNKVMSLVAFAKLAIECGEASDVNGYITEIQAISACTNDCSCTDGEPSLVVGLGGTAINVIVSSGGSPITVTSNTVGSTKTYTVTLDQAFVDAVNNSYNTTLTSDDSSVTIVSSGTNPLNYDLSVNLDVVNKVELKCTITYANPIATAANVTIDIASVVVNGTLFQTPTIAVNDPLNDNWLYIANSIKVSDFFITSPNNDYKVLISGSREDQSLFDSINGFGIFDVSMFGRDDADGVFYLKFFSVQMFDMWSLSNSQLAGVKEELTIVISL